MDEMLAWDVMDMSEKVVVVTGGNTGLGFEDVRQFVKLGAKVVIASRSEEKGRSAVKKIEEEFSGAKVLFMQLDLSSSVSIRRFVREYVEKKLPLHILVNNAGVSNVPFKKTEDGYEITVGTNHFGTFLLTVLLVDVLKASAPARVITVSSLAANFGQVDWEDLAGKEGTYSGFDIYSRSKLYNYLFAMELERRLCGTDVHSFVVQPGTAHSDILDKMDSNIISRIFSLFAPLVCQNVARGALSTVFCGSAEELEGKGGLGFGPNWINLWNTSPWSCWPGVTRDEAAQRKFWDETAKIVNANI